MILVINFCKRCGKRIRARRIHLHPADILKIGDEVCNDCMAEYEELNERHKAEMEEFWKGAKR